MASADFIKLSKGSIGGSVVHFDEEMRKYKKHSNKDINPELSHLNYNFGENTWKEIMQKCNDMIDQEDEINPPMRVRQDRVVADYLYIPCPLSIEKQGREDDFFKDAYEWTNEFFDNKVAGAQVHKDEKHNYLDNGEVKESLYHMHILLPAYVEWIDNKGRERKGINGKNFNNAAMYLRFQNMLQEKVLENYGVSYQTGEYAKRKSVEELKYESALELQSLVKDKQSEIQSLDFYKQDKLTEINILENDCNKLEDDYKFLKKEYIALDEKTKPLREIEARIDKAKEYALNNPNSSKIKIIEGNIKLATKNVDIGNIQGAKDNMDFIEDFIDLD